MFRRGNLPRPSELIRHHLNGTGSGFELDDLISWGRPEYEEAANEIAAIANRYRTEDWSIGIANPDARDDLRALAERLEAQGH
jgi:thiamine biosynthesis lipoprotein ApbE